MNAEKQAPRSPVDVAVGVLIDAGGRFLLTSRPPGKVYAGYWEFPGGKVEAGESIEQALRRELHEEIGITIAAPQPWQVELVDYPHALVRLHFCKVFAWLGLPFTQKFSPNPMSNRAGTDLCKGIAVLNSLAT
ncbi:MAG: NUDIX domain-containing protein [Rubrivivax sp.]|nr:NUDIX domain-containing protein [Rubrivivax sp.]